MTHIGEGRVAGFNDGVLWVDENFDLLVVTIPSANNLPTAITRPGTSIQYAGFPSDSLTEVPVHKEYNHDAIVRQKGLIVPQIRPHVHFSPVSSAAGDVKWFFEYHIHFGDQSISGTLSVVTPVSGVAWQEQRVEIGVIELPEALWTVGAQIGCRFYRDPSDPEDTYNDTVAITDSAGWHYAVDSDGSIGVMSKYG